MYQIPTLAERQRTRNCHNCRAPAFAELGTDGSACALMWVWGLGCTTPGPSQLQSSQGDEEGRVPLLRAVGSCPAWETRDWESAEVSICWLQHAFLVVHGSGGRKERDDKNKAADLYLAINHSRVIFFFFDSIWRLCNKWACSWIFYFIPLQLWWSSQVAVAFP